jgi:pilus assembly protein CpaD
MFMSRVKTTATSVKSNSGAQRQTSVSSVLTLAVLASSMLFLPGCGIFQNRHSVTVGSVPDDYRTNHPIAISEQEQHLDVPVASSERSLSVAQRSVVQGFAAQYTNNGSGVVQVAMPSNGPNAAAAKRVLPEIITALRKGGIPQGQIVPTSYDAANATGSPVRVSYNAITASTDQCGKWPDDITNNSENKHYADFGCSYQNNFAAQLANPADLLGPRAQGEVDATKRLKVVKDYQTAEPSGRQEVSY